MSANRRFERRAVHVAAGEAAVVVAIGEQRPSFVTLAGDVGLGGFTLGIERVKFLVEAFFRRFACVDGAADVAGFCRSGSCVLLLLRPKEVKAIAVPAGDGLGHGGERIERSVPSNSKPWP